MATVTFSIANFSLKSTWSRVQDYDQMYHYTTPSTVSKTVFVDLSSIPSGSRVISATFAIRTTGVGDSAMRKERTTSWVSVTNDHTSNPIDITSWLNTMSGDTFGTLGIDFKFQAYGNTSAYSNTSNFTNMVLTVNYELPNSTGTLNPNPVTVGQTLSLTIATVNPSYSHVATLVFGNRSETKTIEAGVTATSWTISPEYLDQIPNAASGTGTVTLTTKNGNNVVGSVTYNITIRASSSTVPTTGTLTVQPANTTIPTGWENIYVQGYSKLNLSLAGPTGIYGSSISNVVFSGWGESVTATRSGSNYTAESGIITTSGVKTITATVTDSRGKSSSVSTSINVIPYQRPSIISITAHRCLNDMTLVDTGTYVRLTVQYNVSPVEINGQSTNTVSTSSWYKQSNHNNFTDAQVSFSNNTPAAIGGGNISADQTYQIKAVVTDHAGNTASAIVSVPTATYVLHFKNGGTSVGIGQAALNSNNSVVINKNWDAYIGDANVAKYPWCLEYKGVIPDNADINDYIYPGTYAIPSNASAGTMTNLPVQKNGRLMVFVSSGNNDRTMSLEDSWAFYGQAFMPYDCSAVYIRYLHTENTAGSVIYGSWKSFISGDGINASSITSGELPIARGGTGASTKDAAYAALGYAPGNTISFPQSTCFTGIITSSNRLAVFTVPVGRAITAAHATLSNAQGYLHTSTGKISSTSAEPFSNWGTVSATVNPNGYVIITIAKEQGDSNFPGTNNAVTVLQIDSLTITFSS